MRKVSQRMPDVGYITGLRTELQRLFAAQDEQIDDLRAVRELRNPIPLPEKQRWSTIEVRDPAVAYETQRVVAALSLNRPSCAITADPKRGDAGAENATAREHWSEEALWEAGAGHPEQSGNTFNLAVDACVADGGAWTKLLFMRDRWEERYSLKRQTSVDPAEDGAHVRRYDRQTEEAKKAAGVPFAWLHVDARSVYPLYTAGRLTEVLEVTKRPLLSTLRTYGLRLGRDGELVPEAVGPGRNEREAEKTGGWDSVEMLEHWTETTCSYVVQGGKNAVLVKQWRHGYGRVPYFRALGYVQNQWRGYKVAWGVAQSKRWLVEYLSFLLTVHADMAARDNKTPMFRTVPETAQGIVGDDGTPLLKEEAIGLGEVVVGRPGETLAPVPFAQVSPALKEQIALVQQRIAGLMTPRVKGELGSGLEGAGFAIAQVLAEARIYQDPIAQHLEEMLVELTRFLWELVRRKVKETVWVYRGSDTRGWIGLGPDDLRAGVRLEWQLDPERATAKLVEGRYHAEQVQAGFESVDQAIEAQGRNPDEVRRGRAVDRMRATAWYLTWEGGPVASQP